MCAIPILMAPDAPFAISRGNLIMVRRYDILKGDRTTLDGTVMGGDSNDMIGDREQAYEEDEVWCSACHSAGRIVCDGPRLSMKGPDGREGALSDDLCVCKCSVPPRLLPSQYSAYVDI
ncbi:PAAR domain-containing protein [Burkholderia vietnamiensis]|uniref:PAAR domain-containing protein n=2 Tax=Burkholderia vietnamiensis TaxID=60552 RepID=UPI0030B7FC44